MESVNRKILTYIERQSVKNTRKKNTSIEWYIWNDESKNIWRKTDILGKVVFSYLYENKCTLQSQIKAVNMHQGIPAEDIEWDLKYLWEWKY